MSLHFLWLLSSSNVSFIVGRYKVTILQCNLKVAVETMCLEYACHTDNIGDENVHHLD